MWWWWNCQKNSEPKRRSRDLWHKKFGAWVSIFLSWPHFFFYYTYEQIFTCPRIIFNRLAPTITRSIGVAINCFLRNLPMEIFNIIRENKHMLAKTRWHWRAESMVMVNPCNGATHADSLRQILETKTFYGNPIILMAGQSKLSFRIHVFFLDHNFHQIGSFCCCCCYCRPGRADPSSPR